jgi:hypothetical protein
MKEKVKYEDLSGWLKLAVVFMYIVMGIWSIAFIYGFITAMLEIV